MAIWLLLSALSIVALYMAVSLGRPFLIAATAFATALGFFMIGLRVVLQRKITRGIRVR
ncbi:MAG: hypothetical protein ACUVS3_09525 [Thermodesulfobacteriota bacterium]